MTCTIILSLLSAAAAFVAAICWFVAGSIKVSPEKAQKLRQERDKLTGIEIDSVVVVLEEGADMEYTMRAQSRWNCYGAFAAGIAALLQVASTIIGLDWHSLAI